MSETKQMIDRRSWKEFQDAKLLWWINRILHTFGWAIVLDHQADGSISEVYPARVRFRGFSETGESAGFVGLTKHLGETIADLEREAAE